MQVVKGFVNCSDFGWFISFGGHQDIYFEVEIYIPDKYKITMNVFDEPLIWFGEQKSLLSEVIRYKRYREKEDVIKILNPYGNNINLDYKRI